MKTAKVTEITKVNEWKWPNGIIYYINMKLDNNEEISLWKKSKEAFKIGDTVNYEMVEENGKTKYKEVKENNYKPRQTYNPEANNRWAMIWMAIKLAFDKVYQWEDDFEKASYLSQRIFDLAMDMYNWPEGEKDNPNLPF